MTLNNFINILEEKGELLRIKGYVNPILEIAEITDRFSKQEGGGKALLFENTGTNFPVLTNAFGSEKRICLALGINDLDDIAKEIDKLFISFVSPKTTFWDKLSMLPKLKQVAGWLPKNKSGKGKCQDVIMKSPDLSALPILQCYPFDGGPFVTLPMVHTVNPENNIRNVGMYRMHVFSKDTTGMHWHKHKTGAQHYNMYKEKGEKMPVVVTLGGDPIYTYAATAPLPDGVDEYIFAGFLRKKNVELVSCITQPLRVPSDVDFVIEGYVDTSEDPVIEGPFGDHTGFYSLCDLFPKFHVTCITHKQDAIYPATLVGIPPQEDAYIAKATERIFLSPIRLMIAPEVEDMNLPVAGVAHNIAIVKIKKTYAGQALKIASALWGAGQMMFNKIIIIVSGDVNIHNYKELMQHIANNIDIKNDIYFAKGPLDILDHAAQASGFGGKICIDASEKSVEEKSGTKNATEQNLYSFVHKKDFDPNNISSKINVIFDDFADLQNIEQAVWILGNNIDAVRDCKIINNKLIIDATSKIGGEYTRPWPNIACSNNATINAIDTKWQSLGLGEFIESPSSKTRHLVISDGAQVQ